ncbi:conserved hypothetical protein [uncultured Mycobacterium sp.]|uniref:GmrSD restriction endonucleases N-terminal domain-containing protein n=1 Tax=uncultured Mycobacterium sp. TaxID=171292 RepID=A0A1Y5PTX1_9MYCO|nr:conserved hypothetical protein [uncultured Mycobacterium sp.]
MAQEGSAGLAVSLLEGEAVGDLRATERPSMSDSDLNKRYLKEGVRIVTEQARYPLNQILTMFTDTFVTESGAREAKYKRDPEYQRRHRWDGGRKSRLIESFLMNVPVPPIFLYEYDLARFEVMDGRQRLTALMEFYNDDLELEGLVYWPELNGRVYSRLPSTIRDGIDRRYLSSIILLNETASDEEQAAALKKLVFERLNSGGVRLSGQETRNAVYNGPLNDLCLDLSHNTALRSMLGTPLPSETYFATDDGDDDAGDREPVDASVDEFGVKVTDPGRRLYEAMDDVEIVLRFFAYRHIDQFPAGLNKITEFLDKFLQRGNKFPAKTLNEYRQLFESNISFWFQAGGSDAFRVKGNNRHFSKIAFDALMFASSRLTQEQRAALSEDPEAVRNTIEEMYGEHGVEFGGRKTNIADVRRRNKLAINALGSALTMVQN